MNRPAFLLVLLSAFLHAAWNFAARKVSGDLSVIWLGLCVASITCAPFALPLVFHGGILAALPYIAATGVLNALYFFLLAKAYEGGELSSVYPMARGSGVAGTFIAASVWLHETPSRLGVLGVGAVCLGVFLLGRPGRGRETSWLWALLVGATMIGYSLVDKLAVRQVHPVPYIFGMYLVATAILAPYIWLRQRERCATAWARAKRQVLLIGLGSMGTYLMILFAFRMGPLGYIVAVREFAVVLGAFLGFALLKERCTPMKGAGVAAVAAGLVLLKLA